MLTFNEMAVIYNALEAQGDDTVCTFGNGDKIVIADLKAKVKKIGTTAPVTYAVNVNVKDIANMADVFAEIEKKRKRCQESAKSPKETVREYFAEYDSQLTINDGDTPIHDYADGVTNGVIATLNLLGIKIEGVNA